MEPRELGRYRVEAEIGRGAMGVVYRATDPLLGRRVAIKTIQVELPSGDLEGYAARFLQEARAAGQLNHPNIVTVYDVGRSERLPFIAMELIEGIELAELLAAGHGLGPAQAVAIAVQIAEALDYAHQRGVVHRDIKPGNVMVMPGAAIKITDFGIARLRATPEESQPGTTLGAPRYMSPERVLGQRADHRADIFSLGVILYEMLAGAAPFGGENAGAVKYQIVNIAPPAPSALRAGLPRELDTIVARMLAKPIEERYPSAGEAARDLRACEGLLGRPAAAAAAPPRVGTALAPGDAPAPVDPQARSAVLGQAAPRTRGSDPDS